MTKKGVRALRRYAKAQGWSARQIVDEAQRIDRAVNAFMATDPHVTERDRHWLEMVVRTADEWPDTAQTIMAIHYPGLLPGQVVQ